MLTVPISQIRQCLVGVLPVSGEVVQMLIDELERVPVQNSENSDPKWNNGTECGVPVNTKHDTTDHCKNRNAQNHLKPPGELLKGTT